MTPGLVPAFDPVHVLADPWTRHPSLYFWIWLMGFLVTAACGTVGTWLVLRRMSMMGDAISHSILPGLVVAFLISGTRGSAAMFAGALAVAVLTTVLIGAIHRRTRVKEDAAIGIVFSSLFAAGVVLISLFSDHVDLDADCVLYGEMSFVALEPFASVAGIPLGPPSVVRMGVVLGAVLFLVLLFYRQWLASSFDPGLARSLGMNNAVIHLALMVMVSVVAVSAFEAAGAILVIAMLILPSATGRLLSDRLPVILGLNFVLAALSSLLGMHLAIWLDSSMAAAMVVAAFALFLLALLVSPRHGLLTRRWRSRPGGPAAAS